MDFLNLSFSPSFFFFPSLSVWFSPEIIVHAMHLVFLGAYDILWLSAFTLNFIYVVFVIYIQGMPMPVFCLYHI